ncbi:NAD(P)H-dependent glycerol-3-phosphate dehydrogenase [Campylobacter sp. LR291e]|uniref:NAD(P)H-dependent glycerol-3-phosphate dehydrogenase n=1 Tax=Campylobacter sp. LR291e TaxID=2593546 RepID=UPI00123B7B0E|nr:NAD(P)H-dependent glycerol-3-phosphate dehydrogenase [Campylobacter sp. LR291e]KAA6234064.1 NAD(P)H-dependent glycerol-3-phosphate dehydrogenase [Campylobacter sp. LR291e]
MDKIAIIGAGKWGLALKNAINENYSCVITSYSKKNIKDFVSIEEALKAEFLIFVLSTQGILPWLKEHFKNKNQKILLASKGIDISTNSFLDEIFLKFVDKENFCVLSGPSFASEVMQKLPCGLVISGENLELCKKFASFFPSYIKTYIDSDIKGAEICGAYKNVLAIASGISDGLNLGNNARASLISRGLIEMHRFGKFFGAKEETFLGLSGAGDLFLTATSTLSRNYRCGLMLSKGLSKDEIIKELKEVIEGIPTAYGLQELAKKNDIYTPIVNEVVAVLNGKNVKDALSTLLKDKK